MVEVQQLMEADDPTEKRLELLHRKYMLMVCSNMAVLGVIRFYCYKRTHLLGEGLQAVGEETGRMSEEAVGGDFDS